MIRAAWQIIGIILTGYFCFCAPVLARDSNIKYPLEEIEKMLREDAVEIALPRDVRFKGDAAKTAILKRSDGFFLRVKFKRAPQGGGGYNNQPRYEIAAYEFQKLFLKPEEYVVPPTAARGFPLERYREIEPHVRPTFANSSAVLCALQFWLDNVSTDNVYDADRFQSDSLYARHFANFNLFTYLIRHSDSNVGNCLISTDPANPRVFAVDNGLAFGNLMSERGYVWRNPLIKRFPKETVARLRALQYQELAATLGVVAQYRLEDGQLVVTEPGENLDENKGVRRDGNIIQLGLTRKEIDDVYARLQAFLEKVDAGEYVTF